MSAYGSAALVIAVFSALFGAFLCWLASRFDKEEVINFRRWTYLAGGFFLVFSIMTIPAYTIDALENGDQPPCEWLENRTNQTMRYGWNYTGYHWDYGDEGAPDGPQTENADYTNLFHVYEDRTLYNTCANVTAPAYVSALFVIQNWIIWGLFFALMVGLVIYAIRVMGRVI